VNTGTHTGQEAQGAELGVAMFDGTVEERERGGWEREMERGERDGR
jgi:hypothetical protein